MLTSPYSFPLPDPSGHLPPGSVMHNARQISTLGICVRQSTREGRSNRFQISCPCHLLTVTSYSAAGAARESFCCAPGSGGLGGAGGGFAAPMCMIPQNHGSGLSVVKPVVSKASFAYG